MAAVAIVVLTIVLLSVRTLATYPHPGAHSSHPSAMKAEPYQMKCSTWKHVGRSHHQVETIPTLRTAIQTSGRDAYITTPNFGGLSGYPDNWVCAYKIPADGCFGREIQIIVQDLQPARHPCVCRWRDDHIAIEEEGRGRAYRRTTCNTERHYCRGSYGHQKIFRTKRPFSNVTITFRSNGITSPHRGAMLVVLCRNQDNHKKAKKTKTGIAQGKVGRGSIKIETEVFKLYPVDVTSYLCLVSQLYHFGGVTSLFSTQLPIPSNWIQSGNRLRIDFNKPILCECIGNCTVDDHGRQREVVMEMLTAVNRAPMMKYVNSLNPTLRFIARMAIKNLQQFGRALPTAEQLWDAACRPGESASTGRTAGRVAGRQ